jgi:hypothetical protein
MLTESCHPELVEGLLSIRAEVHQGFDRLSLTPPILQEML